MMNRKLLVTIFFGVTLVIMGTISQIEASSKQFGIGFAVGQPTDLSAKYWLSGNTALDFGLGWSTGYGYDRYGDCWDQGYYNRHSGYCNDRGYYYSDYNDRNGYRGLHLHMDYLFHNFNVFRSSERIPLFYGPGISVNFWNHGDVNLGIRGDIGIAWMPHTAPFDIFFELAPVMMIVPGTFFDFNAGLGGRFYF